MSHHSHNVLGAGGKLRHRQPENIYCFRREEREQDLGITFHNKLFKLLLIIPCYCCLIFLIIIKVLGLILLLQTQEEYFQLPSNSQSWKLCKSILLVWGRRGHLLLTYNLSSYRLTMYAVADSGEVLNLIGPFVQTLMWMTMLGGNLKLAYSGSKWRVWNRLELSPLQG